MAGQPGSVKAMPFSFIILTYNSSSYIRGILDSIFDIAGDIISKGQAEVLVVDNESSDDTLKIAYEYGEKIHIKQSGGNLGYAKGINKAVEFAKGDFLVIVNPDAKLLEFEYGKILDTFERDKKLAAAGLSIQNFEGIHEETCGNFFNPFTFLLYAMGFEKLAKVRFAGHKVQYVDFVSGGFIIFRKSYFDELKGYDEDYFMYVEDMDICKRIYKKGLKTAFLPYGKILHKGQGSSSRQFAIVNIYKGLVTFYSKHSNFFGLLYVKILLRIKAVLIIFIGTFLGKKDTIGAYTKALKAIS